MTEQTLRKQAIALLARREHPGGVMYYLSKDWRRQLVFAIAYLLVALALWHAHWVCATVGWVGFFVGRTVREFRWWRALSVQWPQTAELLDWNKIESLAGEKTG